MKLFKPIASILLMILCIWNMSGQNGKDRVSFKMDNIKLSEAMSLIEEKTDYTFFYNPEQIDLSIKVSVEAQRIPMKNLLETMLKDTQLDFNIIEYQIALIKKNIDNTDVRIVGTIVDENGSPLPGAAISVKGGSTGTIADADGAFSLQVPANSELEISFLGFKTQTLRCVTDRTLQVMLEPDVNMMEAVVVTAMGIERKAKSLTYATQNIGGAEVNRVKETNLISSLQGKSAGLLITPNSTGAGGSARILLRGNKSAQGNNQPLIVIDGIPMANPVTTQMTGVNGGRDGGDALSNINPDDIASINVLKGASAAALYGSMAANGVIMITTKKGQEGTVKATFSSNTTLETPLVLPELQSRYGAKLTGSALSYKSWGDKITEAPAKNRLSDFFRVGMNLINSVSFSGGTKMAQTYFSYANTTAKGIVPTNDFMRHNVTLREVMHLFDDKLTIDVSANYINQYIRNRPHGGKYSGTLPGLYTFPANGDFQYYKENYEIFNEYKNRPEQNWYTPVDDFTANPYWTLHRNQTIEKRSRTMLSGSLKYRITDYLSVQGRMSFDKTKDNYDNKIWATTSKTFGDVEKGRYVTEDYDYSQFYMDGMINYSQTFRSAFSINASLGASMLDFSSWKVRYNSQDAPPVLPNYFVYQNSTGNPLSLQDSPRRRLNSIFGTIQFGYKDMVYLDVTGRNDWASTLAFTDNMSYFYPSVGLTAIISEMVKMPSWLNFTKVRASYSVVGNDMPPYITHPLDGFSKGTLSPNNEAPFSEMKPEKLNSLEVGLETMMFNRNLSFDFTFYRSNNRNQYFAIEAPVGSGYSSYYINTGNIQNMGFETTVGLNTDFNKDWNWYSEFNFSYNKNEIKELDPRLNAEGVKIGSGGGFNFMLKEGGAFGDIYTRHIIKDDKGVIQLDKDGFPMYDSEYTYAGNVNPDFLLGWSNTISYKNFSLYLLIDGKIGGRTIGLTQSYLDNYGVSEASAAARDNGGVDLGDGTKIDAEKYYSKISGSTCVGSEYNYSLTNFRLRELSVGYRFKNLLGVHKDMEISLVARNLFIIYKDAPHDPEMSISNANGYQSIDVFALPSTRTFGLNVKLSF